MSDEPFICCVCVAPIGLDDRPAAQCWTDPDGQPCVAHFDCLVRVGEFELGFGNGRRWS